MPGSFERSVIVTGAASGIGAAVARRIAGPETALLLHTGRNADGLAAVAADCRAAGSEVVQVLGDLGAAEVCARIVSEARAAFGRVDQLVSNAGKAARAQFGGFGDAELIRDFEIMPLAFCRIVTAALDDLAASDWGRVVAVSSFVAHAHGKAGTAFPTTAAAKAALEELVRALALQLAPCGTTANCVVPGFTRKQGGGHLAVTTGTLDAAVAATPTGRLTEPADVAEAVTFLLSRGAGQVTGTALPVDGGLLLG